MLPGSAPYSAAGDSGDFGGFIRGVELVPIPAPLTADLLNAIDSLEELKLLLRIINLLNQKIVTERFLTIADVASDVVVSKIFGAYSEQLTERVSDCLLSLRKKQILLHAFASGESYFLLNTEPNRQLIKKLNFTSVSAEDPPEAIAGDPAQVGSARVVRAFEENIGVITHMVGEKIQFWLNTYGEDEIMRAIEISVNNGVRNLVYIDAILRRGLRANEKAGQRVAQDSEKQSERDYFEQLRRG